MRPQRARGKWTSASPLWEVPAGKRLWDSTNAVSSLNSSKARVNRVLSFQVSNCCHDLSKSCVGSMLLFICVLLRYSLFESFSFEMYRNLELRCSEMFQC